MPISLYLFHLLEYMDVDYTIDTDEINERWTELAAIDQWSQLILKQPGTRSPRSSRRRERGRGRFSRADGSNTADRRATGTASRTRASCSSCGSMGR